jgi:hypothetical protein
MRPPAEIPRASLHGTKRRARVLPHLGIATVLAGVAAVAARSVLVAIVASAVSVFAVTIWVFRRHLQHREDCLPPAAGGSKAPSYAVDQTKTDVVNLDADAVAELSDEKRFAVRILGDLMEHGHPGGKQVQARDLGLLTWVRVTDRSATAWVFGPARIITALAYTLGAALVLLLGAASFLGPNRLALSLPLLLIVGIGKRVVVDDRGAAIARCFFGIPFSGHRLPPGSFRCSGDRDEGWMITYEDEPLRLDTHWNVIEDCRHPHQLTEWLTQQAMARQSWGDMIAAERAAAKAAAWGQRIEEIDRRIADGFGDEAPWQLAQQRQRMDAQRQECEQAALRLRRAMADPDDDGGKSPLDLGQRAHDDSTDEKDGRTS